MCEGPDLAPGGIGAAGRAAIQPRKPTISQSSVQLPRSSLRSFSCLYGVEQLHPSPVAAGPPVGLLTWLAIRPTDTMSTFPAAMTLT